MHDCFEKNFTWVNSKISFDHVGQAYLALFQVVCFTTYFKSMKISQQFFRQHSKDGWK